MPKVNKLSKKDCEGTDDTADEVESERVRVRKFGPDTDGKTEAR